MSKPHHNHPSPLLTGLKWPMDDLFLIKQLHGPNWMFYLVCIVRRHLVSIINTHPALQFAKREPKLTYEPMTLVTKLFSPSSLLLLYRFALEFYKDQIITETLEYDEEYYFNLLRDYINIERFEHNPDWFWQFALSNVVFAPEKTIAGISTALQTLYGINNHEEEWKAYLPQEKHSGAPNDYIHGRFGTFLTTLDNAQNSCPIVTTDVKTNDMIAAKIPTTKGVHEEKKWGFLYKTNSPFHYAIFGHLPHPAPSTVHPVDHFYLSLYKNDIPGASFEFLMALDILQYNWTHTDWNNNIWATSKYWSLKDVDQKEMQKTVNLPYNTAIFDLTIAITPQNQLITPQLFDLTPTGAGSPAAGHAQLSPQVKLQKDREYFSQHLYLTSSSSQSSPKILHELALSIKVFAADMVFDYSSDEALTMAYNTLSSVVHNPVCHKKQRSVDYIVADHLKRKIDLFNTIRTQQQQQQQQAQR